VFQLLEHVKFVNAALALTTEIAPVLQPDDHEPVETVAAAISLAQSDADRFKE
jgi:hypothetical protein